jgi:anhydro-N-acetylmuramic acid kinase
MTGTSLDGVDAAIVRFFYDESNKLRFELIGYHEIPIPKAIRDSVMRIINEPIRIAEVSQTHFALSHLYADAIRKTCDAINFPLEKIDLIGIHGQTVWHEPSKSGIAGYDVASTLQLGSVSALANLTGKKVVGDFRSADIANGGQGAPLVPIFDYEFLSDKNESRIALNIGGMSNITFMPADCKKSDVIAFDTGPGNVLIDAAMNLFFGKDYDEDGAMAETGQAINCLLDELRCIPFINQRPPKSTGRELFNLNLVNAFVCTGNFSKRPKEDAIRTLTDFTAWSIAENIREFADEKARLIVSGGGAKNKYLMKKLAIELPKAKIQSTDDYGIPSSAKEAICFAYLAFLNQEELQGNMPSVTGATREVVLGVVAG